MPREREEQLFFCGGPRDRRTSGARDIMSGMQNRKIENFQVKIDGNVAPRQNISTDAICYRMTIAIETFWRKNHLKYFLQ